MQLADATDEQAQVARSLERLITWLRLAREPIGLSASAVSVLVQLDAAGPLRITELAAREELSQPGTTILINRLEDSGLVTRQPDASDRRAVLVAITDEGTAAVTRYRDARASRIRDRIAQLSRADQDALIAAIPAFDRFAPQERNSQ